MENLKKTRISFVRHGTVDNPNDLFYGRLAGFPLSLLGRQQILATKEYFKDQAISSIYCSPQLRAYQTAKIILEARQGLKLSRSKLLAETLSPFDGRPISEAKKLDWDIYTGAGPEFEQPADVLARALKFIRKVRLKNPGEHIVAVTHRDVIVFALLWLNDQPITPSGKRTIGKDHIAPGSISTFTFSTDASGEKPTFSYVDPYH